MHHATSTMMNKIALGSFGLVALVFFCASEASASDLVLGVDTSAGVSTSLAGPSATSWGLRVGVQLPVPLIKLIPEVRLSVMTLGEQELIFDPVELQSLRLGGKIALESPFSPFVYGHMGWTRAAGPMVGLGDESLASSYDAGVGLDFTVLPLVNFGVSAGGQWLEVQGGSDEIAWVEVGVHLEIKF